MMHRWRGVALTGALLLCGCSSFESPGEPVARIAFPAIEAAYLPLHGWTNVVIEGRAAAIVVAPGIAATNAHNADLVAADVLIGKSADYDLLFFRAPGRNPPPIASPEAGERVLAYGQGADNDLRVAKGVVRQRDLTLDCPGCSTQHVFTFEADAGHGFSGGPVVDAETGALLGVVFGFKENGQNSRTIYAYDMAHVMAEFAKIQ